MTRTRCAQGRLVPHKVVRFGLCNKRGIIKLTPFYVFSSHFVCLLLTLLEMPPFPSWPASAQALLPPLAFATGGAPMEEGEGYRRTGLRNPGHGGSVSVLSAHAEGSGDAGACGTPDGVRLPGQRFRLLGRHGEQRVRS